MCSKIKIWLSLAIALLSIQVYGQIKLPRLISDGMVLQRDRPINIWGWAAAGEALTVTIDHKTYRTVTAPDGKWQVKLAAMKAGGPFTMLLSGKNQITIQNILIGDVWVCSGQSNMEFWMGRVQEKYADMIKQSANNAIRQFLVEQQYNFQSPQQDVRSKQGWQAADPKSVLQFTAVGYFFAKALYERYHVPIGLINSSRGGSPAEAWLSEDALKAFPNYEQQLQQLKDSAWVSRTLSNDKKRSREWGTKAISDDAGTHDPEKPWFAADLPDTDWTAIPVPSYWEEKTGQALHGVIWYRKEIVLPEDWQDKEATLRLGNIADDDITYVNGRKVGMTSSRYFARVYRLPAGLLKAGRNNITVRIVNTSGQGGFIKDKPYRLESGNLSVSLEGEWKFKPGVVMPTAPKGTTFAYKPLGLFNSMIAPLTGYTIHGVIWYQGEANTNRAIEYRDLFPALIADWRKQWSQGDFPFLYVQLAGYLPAQSQPGPSQWAELREAQLMTLRVPHTGMAVASDIGEWNDVHPMNKQDVGKRLVLAASKVAYQDNAVVYSGPIFKTMRFQGKKAVITFSNTGSGLAAKNGKTLDGFAIAGSNGKFFWAKAEITKPNEVTVWSDEIDQPAAVRYSWADFPDTANLINKEGLPASSFRTDVQDKTEVVP